MLSFFNGNGWKNTILRLKIRRRQPGWTLLATVMSIFCWLLVAQSFFMMSSGTFNTAKAERVALQAEQVAQIDITRLHNLEYDNLDSQGAHARKAIEGLADSLGWESEVTIDPEQPLSGSGGDAKVRIAHLAVYRQGDAVSRYNVDVPLTSIGSGRYVKNDSGNHDISSKYDETTKTVKTYVDGKEIKQKTAKSGALIPVYASLSDRSKIVSIWRTGDTMVQGGNGSYYCSTPYAYQSVTGYVGSTEFSGSCGSGSFPSEVLYGYRHDIDPREAYSID